MIWFLRKFNDEKEGLARLSLARIRENKKVKSNLGYYHYQSIAMAIKLANG
jgi:hypothetical protein